MLTSFLLLALQGTITSFLPPDDWPLADDAPADIAIVDLDRDGDLDLVVPSTLGPDPTIRWNDGAGAFPDEETIPSAFPSWGVGVGDFDGNGWPDLVFGEGYTGGNRVEVWFGNPADPARPILGQVLTAGDFPVAFRAGDLDGDGDEDLVVADNALYSIVLFRNLGGGVFGPMETVPGAVSARARRLELADVDRDGDLDVVFTAYGLNVLLNDGTGHFPTRNVVGAGHVGLAVADFDQDGLPDFAVADLYSSRVEVLLGDGAGGAILASTLSFTADVGSVLAADLNGDGLDDLAVTASVPGQVEVATGHGDGSFHAAQAFAAGFAPQTAASGDLDGDGDLDLAVPDRLFVPGAVVSILDNVTPPESWRHLGLGLRGPSGDLPLLRGAGVPSPGLGITLDLLHGPPSGAAVLLVGTSRLDSPYHGGTVVPSPDHVLPPIPLDASGHGTWSLTVPPTVPPGSSAWFQAWAETRDAASNGLRVDVG